MEEWQLEMAARQEEQERADALAETARKALPDKLLQPEEYLSEDCEDCEEPLTEFRKQRGCVKCVVCLQAEEKRRKLFYQS